MPNPEETTECFSCVSQFWDEGGFRWLPFISPAPGAANSSYLTNCVFFLMADTFCYFRCILTLDARAQIWANLMDTKVYHVWFVWTQPFRARAWFWNCAWGHLKRWSCARFMCAWARSAGGVETAMVKRVSVVFFIVLQMIFGELQMMVVAVYIVHGCVRHQSTKQMLPSWWRKWFLLVCKTTLVHTVPGVCAHAKMFRNETKLLIWKLSSGFEG